jgi:3-methylfumaryl-CoA hydratase
LGADPTRPSSADPSTVDVDHLRQWVGKAESDSDTITSAPLAALLATLDRDDPPLRPGDSIPPLSHWLYFRPAHRQSEIAHDGHPRRGGLLPPVPLPRRMWAGSEIVFHRPLRIGETLSRQSRIANVEGKAGRSGSLVFVHVRHTIGNPGDVALTEDQHIVYRANPTPGEKPLTSRSAPTGEQWSRPIHPDEVLLFRYSALTFNAHRIHYDRRYATEVEGYPGLVVHGPLIATLLLETLHRNLPSVNVVRFAFRAVKPLFDGSPLLACGRLSDGTTAELWAKDADGCLAMEANATLI